MLQHLVHIVALLQALNLHMITSVQTAALLRFSHQLLRVVGCGGGWSEYQTKEKVQLIFYLIALDSGSAVVFEVENFQVHQFKEGV